MVPLGRLTRDELRDEYRRADLLLFPTRLEGFGYAVAEAMACGTPVVTTRCSALPELVDDGRTGRLCRMDDVAGFADAVRELVADNELLYRMGRAARMIAIERFSMSRMAHSYAALLAELGS
jgi:glycosyltransferase involved in cell wall biosynthesis